MTSLGVILARGGSKGIPRKNLVELGGKPLLWWTIGAALESGLDHVWVSTDSEDIAEAAIEAGAHAIQRPEGMANDDAPPELAMRNALDIYNAEYDKYPEIIFRLQPTSPFRSVGDINTPLAMVIDGAQSVIGITEMPVHPNLAVVELSGGFVIPHEDLRKPRQRYQRAMAINGAVYCARTPYWRTFSGYYGPETVGYEMPAERAVDIDNEWDLRLARALA